MRLILIDGGLPRPTAQIRVPLPGDRNAYLDLGWEPYKVAVEYDGRAHHAGPADQRRDDLRRQELNRLGWRVIAVGRDVIPARTADFLEHVANALMERGWQPGPDGMIRILTHIRAAVAAPGHDDVTCGPSTSRTCPCASQGSICAGGEAGVAAARDPQERTIAGCERPTGQPVPKGNSARCPFEDDGLDRFRITGQVLSESSHRRG